MKSKVKIGLIKLFETNVVVFIIIIIHPSKHKSQMKKEKKILFHMENIYVCEITVKLFLNFK
jgi:hypothetical protein